MYYKHLHANVMHYIVYHIHDNALISSFFRGRKLHIALTKQTQHFIYVPGASISPLETQ